MQHKGLFIFLTLIAFLHVAIVLNICIAYPGSFFNSLSVMVSAAFLMVVAVVFQFFGNASWQAIAFGGIVLTVIAALKSFNVHWWLLSADLLLLIVIVVQYANDTLQDRFDMEASVMLNYPLLHEQKNPATDVLTLPPVVAAWLYHSGALQQPPVHAVRLRQAGNMRTKPGGRWWKFIVKQYMITVQPAFHWQVRVNLKVFGFLNGRDMFFDGKGTMLIHFLSLVNIVRLQNTPAVNQDSLLRYLAEICWFPSAALSPYISWKQIDEKSAEAVISWKGTRGSGTFFFDEDHHVVAFEGQRHYTSGGSSSLQKWHVRCAGHTPMQGIIIPASCEVTWKLPEADFTWLRLNIIEINYNIHRLYPSV